MEINTKISTDEISNDDDGSSSCTNIDQLIENFEWLVMIISLGEEEIRFAQHYEDNLLHSEHSRIDSNGESLDYSSSNVLRAMGDFLYLLSISFSKLCANINNDNVDQTSFGQRWYRDPQSSDAKKVLMHTFVMIKLYVADKLSPRSSCSGTCAGTIALECLLHILELLLEKDWVIDNEQTLSDKAVSEAVDRRWSMRADAAITFFANITDAVEASLQHALPVINDGFDSAGNLMKQNIRPISEDKQVKIPENVVKSAELARQASVRAHEASKGVFVGIGQVATKAVNMTAKQVETGSENSDILNSERKDILNATSRVALAGFGAFASISEALFDTSLASKSLENSNKRHFFIT